MAKYLRFNCPTKSTNMLGHRVDYFIGRCSSELCKRGVCVIFFNAPLCIPTIASKAVDCLLDSKWAKAKKGEEALFTTRESVVDYCNRSALTQQGSF